MVQENLEFIFADTKGADQPMHQRSPISALVVRVLQCICFTHNFFSRSKYNPGQIIFLRVSCKHTSNKIELCSTFLLQLMSRDTRDPDVNTREQRRRRPACASAQSDQRLSNSRPIMFCFTHNFVILDSLISRVGRSKYRGQVISLQGSCKHVSNKVSLEINNNSL